MRVFVLAALVFAVFMAVMCVILFSRGFVDQPRADRWFRAFKICAWTCLCIYWAYRLIGWLT